jgi:5'-deoxynucleotidase YfbR-like HD superfamily hydrolase
MDNQNILKLLHIAGQLKKIKRSGWIRAEIPNPESVSDHSFRCAFMAMVLGDVLDLDCEKLMKMALIHDLGESKIGDITPYDGVSEEIKKTKEDNAISQIFQDLPREVGYLQLWNEYQAGETKEAQLIKEIDKLEMVLTAYEYQKEFPQHNLSEFYKGLQNLSDIPEIQALYDELKMQEKAIL